MRNWEKGIMALMAVLVCLVALPLTAGAQVPEGSWTHTIGVWSDIKPSGDEAVQQAQLAADIAERALGVARDAVQDTEYRLEAAVASDNRSEIRAARSALRRARSSLKSAERMAAQVAALLDEVMDAAQRAADAETDRERDAAESRIRVTAARAARTAERMRKRWLDPETDYFETEIPTTTTTTTTTTQESPETYVKEREPEPAPTPRRRRRTPDPEDDPTPVGEEV